MTDFVEAVYPRGTLVEMGAPQPQDYLVALVDHLQRCSLPAAARFGALRAAVVRRGVVATAVRGAMRFRTVVQRSDFDGLREGLLEQWSELAGASQRLPPVAPQLRLLCLRRSFGWLVFVFGAGPHPLLVCKLPEDDDRRVQAEVERLGAVKDFAHAPRHLARVGSAYVQDAMPGQPLRLAPLRWQEASQAGWSTELEGASTILACLGRLTSEVGLRLPATQEVPDGLIRTDLLDRLRGSQGRLLERGVCVVRHKDVGPQNVLATGGRVTGIVDWEMSQRGLPGADVLQLLVSVFEQRLGLVDWDDRRVATAFAGAWGTAPLFVHGREQVRAAVESAGLASVLARDVEAAFFFERLVERCQQPEAFLVSPWLAAQMLDAVVGR